MAMNDSHTKKLEEMLHSYQQFAMSSLAGPASAWMNVIKPNAHSSGHRFATLAGNQMSKILVPGARKAAAELPFDFKLSPRSFPILPPFLLQPDIESQLGELVYCDLEDVQIAGFLIGGEERLCFPPILRTILRDVDFVVIQKACDALLIHCSSCTAHQLRLLKQENVLPPHVSTAGLIRKTDAERLCTLLLHFKPTQITDPDLRTYPQINNTCIPVYHECFGEGHGFFYTELYTHSYARCISCADCEKLFSPERFVTHTHFNQENKICHWGFNRRNWRNYLLLSEDEVSEEEMSVLNDTFQQVLDKFKNCTRKRKPATADLSDYAVHTPSAALFGSFPIGSLPIASGSPSIKRRCNRPPMKAYQYVKENPKVENPDLVVSHADKHLYGKHFVPNICLKPGPPSNTSQESVTEETGALDLRSPTLRERHSSTCSTSQTKNKAIIDDKPEQRLAGETAAEEILDVESCDEPDVVSEITEEVVSKNASTSSSSENNVTGNDVTSCIENMRNMFLAILNETTLSEDAKNEKKKLYIDCIAQLKQTI